MQRTLRVPLSLLLLLASALLASCQLDVSETSSEGEGGGATEVDRPAVGSFFPMRIEQIKVQKHSTVYYPGQFIELRCTVSSGNFHAWVKNMKVVGNTPAIRVEMTGRDKFGIYICVGKIGGKYYGMHFVVNEMPRESVPVTELFVRMNTNAQLRCQAKSDTGRYKWYRYNDMRFTFEEMPDKTGKEITLQYSFLADKDKGFTYYKCLPEGGLPDKYEAFKLMKEPNEELIGGTLTKVYQSRVRPIPSDVGAVPIAVTPKSKVTFECEKVSPSETAKWYFRAPNTTSPRDYTELGSGAVEVSDSSRSSVLSVSNCDVGNKGYYRCKMGDVVRYAFLDIQVIVPTIHEYSKSEYDMSTAPGDMNELECEIPLGGEVNDVVWRVVPGSGPPFDIRVNREDRGFRASIKATGVNRLATVSFRDSATLSGYRLECRLGDELDYVMLKYKKPEIMISVRPSDFPNYKMLFCEFEKELTDINFHVNDRKGDTIAVGQGQHGGTSPNATFYFNPTKRQYWFRCSGSKNGARVYSDPVPLVENPLDVGILVDGVAQDPAKPKAKVAGQRTEFVCNFTNYRGANIEAGNVRLMFNDKLLTATAVRSADGQYKFVFDSPEPSNSGSYRCRHAVSDILRKVDSPPAIVNFCTTDQFMCDGGCKDKSVKCDGNKDCADGTDELAVLCADCEPNEVPCEVWKGKAPARKCVLKHWLCDGQDDCENRFDEDSRLAKSWCINNCMNPTMSCPSNSTCCRIDRKCILRAYECDTETDCTINADEQNCCGLRLTSPTRPQPVVQREGSRVQLTCRAIGFERPTISWRCNWGHLRDPKRMTESNRIVRKVSGKEYEVEGTLVITDFRKEDECIYNCEAVSKCKRQLSPEFDVRVS